MCLILSVYEVVVQWPSMLQPAGSTSAASSPTVVLYF